VFKQNTPTETRVAVLEERINIYEQVMDKIEDAIRAISETNQNISKMLAVHDERLEQVVRSDEVIIKMLEEQKKSLEAEDIDLGNRIDELEDEQSEKLKLINTKIDEISKLKWMTIGSATVLAVIVTAASSLISGMWTPSEINHYRNERSELSR
jgi:chromosome segregation ATPase